MSQSDSSKKVVWILAIIGGVGLFAFLLIPAAFFGMFFWLSSSSPDFFGGLGTMNAGLEPGEPAPALVAEGWINGNAPTPESLGGKVVFVEAWASW